MTAIRTVIRIIIGSPSDPVEKRTVRELVAEVMAMMSRARKV